MAAKSDEVRKRKISLFVAKSTISQEEKCLRLDARCQAVSIGRTRGKKGTLYFRRTTDHPPAWLSFFEDHLDPRQFKTSSISAVLIVRAHGRLFALTFGYGRSLLEPTAFEEDFGLKVCLNSIEALSIRSVDRATLEAQGRHGREQSSQPASILEFGLDVEQDILRAVSGRPSIDGLGGRITGHDALIADPKITLENMNEFVGLALKQYRKRRYKADFPWIDNIQELRDQSLKEALESILEERLAISDFRSIWMAVPEIVDWSTISGFTYGARAADSRADDISIPAFLDTLNSTSNLLAKLKQRKVNAVRMDSEQVERSWPAFRCLYAEIAYRKSLYLLNNGKWYEVEPNFRDTVKRSVAQIPESVHVRLPNYGDSDEATYLTRVAKNDSRLALMDRKNIPFGGGASRIEFCDLYDSRGVLVHVKRYGGSSVLSHLFKQGLVSGTLFCSDADFRELVNKNLPVSHRLINAANKPRPGDYEIAFAIVSEVPGKLTLPFFSQVALRSTYRQLSAYGYRVTLNKIEKDA